MKQALLTLLLLSAGPVVAGQIDLRANEQPIMVKRDEAAIAKIPANYRFVEPGTLTVAISALNSPPLALLASDNVHGNSRAYFLPQQRAKVPGL